MSEIKDEVRIRAGATKVFEALTRQDGYRGWWNAVAEVPEGIGKEARLHFTKGGTPVGMRFRIDEAKAPERVRWTCVGHDLQEWVGTTLTWKLAESDGSTLVSFEHGGWKGAPPQAVVDGWRHFLGSLKSYVETGTGQPW